MKEIKEKSKAARGACNMTQIQFASALNIQPHVIREWESNNLKLKPRHEKIATLLFNEIAKNPMILLENRK